MNSPFNGKTKWYAAIIYMLVATLYIVVRETTPKMTSAAEDTRQEFVNAKQIVALETEVKGIKDAFNRFQGENREDHIEINRKLDLALRK